MNAPPSPEPPRLLGRDPQIVQLLEMAERVAQTDAPVLITGESGTGKELLARYVHRASPRLGRPYVAINCGAIAPNLEESELFGHVAGAFTGALGRKEGKIEAADGGTLFLDEVGEMSLNLQVKLLRVLSGGDYSPVGLAASRRADVRVVAATNQGLSEKIAQGTFRPDLYYRLNVVSLEIPPLRRRRGDIPLLAQHFLRRFAARYRRPLPKLSPELEERLAVYPFPGNVRELENLMHRAIILGSSGSLGPEVLPPDLGELAATFADVTDEPASFHEAKQATVERFEREYLTRMLRQCAGIISRAAERSGLSERNFHEKLNRYGIDGRSFRPST